MCYIMSIQIYYNMGTLYSHRISRNKLRKNLHIFNQTVVLYTLIIVKHNSPF